MKKFKLKKEDIKQLIEIKGAGGYLATNRICKVSSMYREESNGNMPDSGWCFF
ncbi:hypothetical protein [Cetobacterium somerae]